MNSSALEQEIAQLESERCQALLNGDVNALDLLLADDLVHVHANGKVVDKNAYLKLVKHGVSFLSARRSELKVRIHGDIGIATGPLEQMIMLSGTTQSKAMNVMTTQVWRRNDAGWRQVNFHATNIL